MLIVFIIAFSILHGVIIQQYLVRSIDLVGILSYSLLISLQEGETALSRRHRF